MSEISASIEESNRMRAELGLPPLAVADPNEERRQREEEQRAREAAEAQRRSEEIRMDLEMRREKRLREAKVSGKSLGEQLSTAGETSAEEWARQNRERQKQLRLKQKKAAEARARQEQLNQQDNAFNEEYTAEHLKGLKVAHDMDELKEETNVVLTLKDAPILANHEANDEEDVLENVNLVDDEKAKQNLEAKRKKPVYNAYSDTPQDILSQYDEKVVGPEGFRLGVVTKEAEEAAVGERLRSTQNALDEVELKKQMYSLDSTVKLQADFYTSEEMASFKKRKKTNTSEGTKKKKARTVRQRTADDLFAQEEGDSASSQPADQAQLATLLSQAELSVDAKKDRGSRSNKRHKSSHQDEAEDGRRARDQRYLSALAKSQEKTERVMVHQQFAPANGSTGTAASSSSDKFHMNMPTVLPGQSSASTSSFVTLPPVSALSKKNKEPSTAGADFASLDVQALLAAEEETDLELQASIERARRLAAARRTMDDPGKSVAQAIQLSSQVKREQDSEKPIQDDDDVIVFTDTTEFCRGLDKVSELDQVKKDKEDLRVKKEKEEESRDANGDVEMVDADDDDEADQQDGKEEKDESTDFIHEEENADFDGLAGVLNMARQRGFLERDTSNVMVGRARDKGPEWEDPSPNIRLEYLDEFGRPMKPKEAFRHLSHKFHGHGPGKGKLEKRMQKMQQEQAMIDNLTKLQTVTKIHDITQKTGKAYLELDGKLKTKQVTAPAKVDDDDGGGKKKKGKKSKKYVA